MIAGAWLASLKLQMLEKTNRLLESQKTDGKIDSKSEKNNQ